MKQVIVIFLVTLFCVVTGPEGDRDGERGGGPDREDGATQKCTEAPSSMRNKCGGTVPADRRCHGRECQDKDFGFGKACCDGGSDNRDDCTSGSVVMQKICVNPDDLGSGGWYLNDGKCKGPTCNNSDYTRAHGVCCVKHGSAGSSKRRCDKRKCQENDLFPKDDETAGTYYFCPSDCTNDDYVDRSAQSNDKCCFGLSDKPDRPTHNVRDLTDGQEVELGGGRGKIKNEDGKNKWEPDETCNSEGNDITTLELEDDNDAEAEMEIDFCDSEVKSCSVGKIDARAKLKMKASSCGDAKIPDTAIDGEAEFEGKIDMGKCTMKKDSKLKGEGRNGAKQKVRELELPSEADEPTSGHVEMRDMNIELEFNPTDATNIKIKLASTRMKVGEGQFSAPIEGDQESVLKKKGGESKTSFEKPVTGVRKLQCDGLDSNKNLPSNKDNAMLVFEDDFDPEGDVTITL